MNVEAPKENIEITISQDTGVVVSQTTIFTTDKRKRIIDFTRDDAIRRKDNKQTWERLKGLGFLGGVLAGAIGGLDLIISGVTNLNPEQIGTGAGAWVLATYMLGSARKAFYETGLAGREKNKIKNAR